VSKIIKMFFNGTDSIFNINNNKFRRKKYIDVKEELKTIEIANKNIPLQRAIKRIKRIKNEALS